LCEMRLEFLQRLPTYQTFGKGWSRRVAEVKLAASEMV
jgi:lysozyme family protein